jgi:hypothetical protein
MKENENDFEALRRLLAFKRHEVPPPGYFENFFSEVMSRIRAGEAGTSDRVFDAAPWLSRILSLFDAKPVYAGAFATVLCLLLLVGIVFAERPEVAPKPLLETETVAPTDGNSLAVAAPVALPGTSTSDTTAPITFVSSTNPVFNTQSAPSWFNTQPAAEQVDFKVNGN